MRKEYIVHIKLADSLVGELKERGYEAIPGYMVKGVFKRYMKEAKYCGCPMPAFFLKYIDSGVMLPEWMPFGELSICATMDTATVDWCRNNKVPVATTEDFQVVRDLESMAVGAICANEDSYANFGLLLQLGALKNRMPRCTCTFEEVTE